MAKAFLSTPVEIHIDPKAHIIQASRRVILKPVKYRISKLHGDLRWRGGEAVLEWFCKVANAASRLHNWIFGQGDNRFASLWASSRMPKIHVLPGSTWHDRPSPLLTPQTGERIVLLVCLLALSGLYSRIFDGQIVWQIRCLNQLKYPCSPGAACSWGELHFRLLESSVSF